MYAHYHYHSPTSLSARAHAWEWRRRTITVSFLPAFTHIPLRWTSLSLTHPRPSPQPFHPPPRRKAGKSGGKKAEGNLQVKFRIQTKAWNCSRAFPNGGLVQPRWLAGIGKSLGVILGTLAKALARTSFYTTRGFINVLSSWHACLLPTSGNLRPWSRASLAFLK